MSLTLTALRLAAIEALNSHPVIARLCEGRIYDSAIGAFEAGRPMPVIVVTTEELKGEALSANNGGPPFRDACDLVLEIAVNQRATLGTGADAEDVILRLPTDGQLEARLNLLDEAAELMLTKGLAHPLGVPTPEGRLLHAAVLKKVTERTLSRFATDETGVRLAVHLLTLRTILKAEGAGDPRDPPTGPFAGLPPALRKVCAAMPAGTSGAATCALIAEDLPAPPDPARPLGQSTFVLGGMPAPAPGSVP